MLDFILSDTSLYLKAILSLLTSFSLCLIFGNKFIRFIKSVATMGQPIQLEAHKEKIGTPTAGGILIIVATFISSLLFANLTNPFILTILLAPLCFGIIGFIDDFYKMKRKALPNYENQYGLSAKKRLLGEFLVAAIAIFAISVSTPDAARTIINIPFLSSLSFNAWWFYYPFAAIVIVGSANAVNITDGMDGLATKTSMTSVLTFIVLMLLSANMFTSQAHNLSFVENSGELIVFASALFGSLLGFLFFNAKPASIFMGDVGSLYLGSIFGIFAVMLKIEMLYGIFGFLFVAELGSSFFQTMYFKYTRKKTGQGKRLFKMAPLHHHFEMMNIPETKVVERFFIVSIILSIIALTSLFVRI